MKKIITVLLSLLLVMTIVLPASAIASVPVKGIKLNISKVTLKVGETSKLTATLSPANTTQKRLTFVTANKNVASISAAGEIKAVGKGTTTITVLTVNQKISAKCNITVTQDPPVKITVMVPLYTPEAPSKDSSVLKVLNQHCNASFEITWVPAGNYNDKINVSIASNQLPQAVAVTDVKAPNFINSAKSGMFWEIGSLLKDYSNLKNYNQVLLTNTAVEGKNYGLPRARVLARTGLVYRKDWLNNVGLKAPTNLTELYNVMKAFKYKDPDKDGKDDTFAYSTVASTNSDFQIDFNVILALNGGGNEWDVKNGKLTPTFMSQAYMDTMDYFKRMYSEGLMNKDFAALKGEAKYSFIDKEQAGMYIGNSDEATTRHNDLLKLKQTENPNIKREDILDIQSFLKDKDGKVRTPGGYGFFGEFVFPKTSVKTESNLKAILTSMNKLDDPEILNLLKWGVEGENYKVENGKAVPITDLTVFNAKVSMFTQMGLNAQIKADATLQGQMEPLVAKYYKEQAENAKNVVMSPIIPFISQTYSLQGAELDKIIHDARIKYIMGIINKQDFGAVTDRWNRSGGNKVIQEYSAEYAKVHMN